MRDGVDGAEQDIGGKRGGLRIFCCESKLHPLPPPLLLSSERGLVSGRKGNYADRAAAADETIALRSYKVV